jgi:aryl-alcohol dehydrogenase-like predicted oxidoreductase
VDRPPRPGPDRARDEDRARPARPGAGTDDALGLSRQAILDQTADSLRRLRTDHVDLLYAHIDDPRVPMAETVGALQEVAERGWARPSPRAT